MKDENSQQKTTQSDAVKPALRARMRLLVCFMTLPLYVLAVWMLLSNGRQVETLMWVYMGLYAVFALDMVRRRCPTCGEQFFVKSILLNLITKRCVHCGR